MALTLMAAAGKFYEHAAFHQHELCLQVLLLFYHHLSTFFSLCVFLCLLSLLLDFN